MRHAHGLGVVDQALQKEVGHAARDGVSGGAYGDRTPLAATPPLHTASNRSLVVRLGRVARLLRPLCAGRWCRTPAVQPRIPAMRSRFPSRPRQARMTAGLAAAHLFWWPFWWPSGRAAEHPRKRSGGVGGKAWEGKFGLAAAAALALAVESITVAFAGSSDSGSADHRVQVIRLLAEHRGPRSRLRQHGFSVGD